MPHHMREPSNCIPSMECYGNDWLAVPIIALILFSVLGLLILAHYVDNKK